MGLPYRARVNERWFLNLPGFHGGAYIVAYVEDTSERGLERTHEPRMDAELERHVGKLLPEQARLLPPSIRQCHGNGRIAVDSVLVVQRRLTVAGDHEQPHGTEPTQSAVCSNGRHGAPGRGAAGQQGPADG